MTATQASPWRDGFYDGVLSALANLDYVTTEYNDIVNTCGRAELINYARKNGLMRSSGLDKYLKRMAA